MMVIKSAGLRFALPLVLQIVWINAALAEPVDAAALKGEASKQTAIYQSRGESVPEGYVINRSLLAYTVTLPSEFNGSLANLGPEDRWLDIGAGEGRAILDYCTSKYDVILGQAAKRGRKKAQAVAMSIEDRRTAQWHKIAASPEGKQIEYRFGKSLREYSSDELGRFKLITDVLGGFSYAQSLSVFMEKALALLEVNGEFFTLLQDVRSERGTNEPFYPGASYLTEIRGPDGSDVKVCSWLKSIGCVEVSCELKQASPPIEVYRIRKVCDTVTVPRLVPLHFEAGTPPERRYQLPLASRNTANND